MEKQEKTSGRFLKIHMELQESEERFKEGELTVPYVAKRARQS